MGWTKRQFIKKAFVKATLASFIFDLTSEELQDIAVEMDAMIAQYDGLGTRISYPIASSPDNVDLDQVTNVPDWANQFIYTNLALAIASDYGKVASTELKAVAASSRNVVISRNSHPGEMQFPRTMPVGAGNKPWRTVNDPFVTRPKEVVDRALPFLTQ